jgi:hypothetical protein
MAGRSSLDRSGGADSAHAWLISLTMNTGMLAPSHQRTPDAASRRNGGVVMTTYAAATPAEIKITFATVRAAERVILI